MWFLWFYLGSIVFCALILLLISVGSAKKLKREHPEIKIKKRNKRSFTEVLCAFLPFLIPFLNLVFILVTILTPTKLINEVVKQTIEENDHV